MSIHPSECIMQIIMKQSSDTLWTSSLFFSGMKVKMHWIWKFLVLLSSALSFCITLFFLNIFLYTFGITSEIMRHNVDICQCFLLATGVSRASNFFINVPIQSSSKIYSTGVQTALQIGKRAIKLLLIAVGLGLLGNLVLSQHAKPYFPSSLLPVALTSFTDAVCGCTVGRVL